VRRSRIVGLTPSWLALRNRVADQYVRWRLSRFFAYASARGVEPDQVNDTTVADFAGALKRDSLLEGQTRMIRDLRRQWNRCAEIEGWPATRLTVPDRRRQYALPSSAYPSSFGADVAAYLDHQARGDLFGGTDRRPASPVTLRDLRLCLFQMAAALVKSGRDPQTIRSLADLAQPEALQTALNFFWNRNGNRRTTQLHGFALTAIKIAKRWSRRRWSRSRNCRRFGARSIPKKRVDAAQRARLRQFDDPENLRRLIDLPQAIVRGLPRQGPPSYVQALRPRPACRPDPSRRRAPHRHSGGGGEEPDAARL
jgi:hypothetical protein